MTEITNTTNAVARQRRSSYVFLDEIDTSLETEKIQVRVLAKWTLFNAKSGNSIEMIWSDKKGTRVQASCEEVIYKKHKDNLDVGKDVMINAFSAKEYFGDFRPSDLTYKLSVLRTTKTKPLSDFHIEHHDKYYYSISQILEGTLDKKVLIDVMAIIVSMGTIEDVKTKGKSGNSSKLELFLKDEGGDALPCTLWGDYAKQVIEHTSQHDGSPIVIVIRFAWIKEYGGKLYISNAYNSTQIKFGDPKNPELTSWLESIPKDSQALIVHTDNKSMVSFGSGCKLDMREEFFSKYRRMTILGILQSDLHGKVVTCATIVAIDKSKKWYYKACKICNLKVQEYGSDSEDDENANPLYNCKSCGDVNDVNARYYLIVRLSDYTEGEAKFLAFDGVGEKMMKKSANDIFKEFRQQLQDDPDFEPSYLINLIGRKLLFKVTIPKDNLTKHTSQPYVVDLVWDDEDAIEDFENIDNSNQGPLMLTHSMETESDASMALAHTPSSSKRSEGSISQSSVGENASVSKKIKQEDKEAVRKRIT